ncbi:MAG: peptide deformylase [Candidatus Nomurabacteria bacterium]|jgi:peptide deformylase|nr:peptide deformylase [Candidatus Nomurabacteria bacterium]
MKKILTTPDPRLRVKSKKVSEITPEIQKIIKEMIELSLDWEKSHPHELSAAMAAPQIGENVRVIILRNSLDDKHDISFTVLINPEIVKAEGVLETDYEGCLSVPRVYGLIKRHSKIRVKALLDTGEEVRFKIDGGFARTIQHEIDHLNGVLFIDHIKHQTDAFFELDNKGNLQPLDYATDIKDNRELWGEDE